MFGIASAIVKNDVICFYALNRKLHCRIMDIVMRNITHLGSTAFGVTFPLLCLKFNRQLGNELALNLIFSQAIIQLLKRIIDRPRPYITLEWAIAVNPPKCRYSLPSGHSGLALSLGLVLTSFFPELKILLIALAIIVGFSRIYLGYHYPSDVLIGFLISYSVYKLLTFFVLI